MLSSNRILKVGTVEVNHENKVIIDVTPAVPFPKNEEEPNSSELVEEAEPVGPTPEEIAANIIGAANQQARRIVEAARNEAAMELAIAVQKGQEDATRIAEEAEKLAEEAQRQGYEDGMNSATSEGDAIKAQAQKILEDAYAERKDMQEKLEPEMVDLVIQIVSKLLDNAIALNPSLVVNLVRQGMASATITGDVVVHVSPQDVEQVVAHKEEIMALTDGSVKLEILRDLSLNPMDCVIETPFGNIDCSLGQQFEALKHNLTHILNTK